MAKVHGWVERAGRGVGGAVGGVRVYPLAPWVQMSHQGVMNAEVVVEPGETEIAHHLMIVDVTQAYR